jgi:hypothetical protein
MPFKSKAQQRWMFAAEARGELPVGTARRWARKTKSIKKLPERIHKKGFTSLFRKHAEVSLRKEHKDPAGGLTSSGRSAYNKATGSSLKPGVRGAANTPEKMRRKGSWAVRFYGRKGPLPPLKKPNGEPTRFALTAAAWGEPVPQTEAAARRIAAKGRSLLDKYRASKKVSK